MKDYDTAVKFERASQVYRLLLLAGKQPTNHDLLYRHELSYELDREWPSIVFKQIRPNVKFVRLHKWRE